MASTNVVEDGPEGAAESIPNDLLIETRTEKGVVRLTLNRPEAFNALSETLMTSLRERLLDIGGDPTARVVVIAGAGRSFCAGHDLRELRAQNEDGLRRVFRGCVELMLAIGRIPKPVIAQAHGVATAAGCQLVAACDLAIAAAGARFAVSGVNLGLFCSTPMVALTRNVPRKAAMELLVTGGFIDAAEAKRLGLVNRVVPDDRLAEETDAFAAAIAGQPPAAIAYGKRLFYRQLEATLEQAYDEAVVTMTSNMLTCDAGEGIDAFLEKRAHPEWKGR